MKIGDLVSYLDRYYGIVVDDGPYYEYGPGAHGVAVVWLDTGFKSWEFVELLEGISESRRSCQEEIPMGLRSITNKVGTNNSHR